MEQKEEKYLTLLYVIYETISFLEDVSIAKKEWHKRAGGERYGICNMLSIRSHYGDFSGYR